MASRGSVRSLSVFYSSSSSHILQTHTHTHTHSYGRREISENAVIGENSAYSDVVRTLRHDFAFDMFNANSTMNHSSVDERNTDGHIGIFGGEGHFGLSLIGDASVENCNASFSCCDSYEEFENGTYTCHRSMSCSALGVVGGREYSENITYDNDVSNPHRLESNVYHHGEDDASVRIELSNNSHARARAKTKHSKFKIQPSASETFKAPENQIYSPCRCSG